MQAAELEHVDRYNIPSENMVSVYLYVRIVFYDSLFPQKPSTRYVEPEGDQEVGVVS